MDGNKAKAGRTLGTAALANSADGGGWVHVVDVCLRVKKGTGGDGGVKPEPYDGAGACVCIFVRTVGSTDIIYTATTSPQSRTSTYGC